MKQSHITFDEISHGSSDWQEVLQHRDRILRQPLGLTLSPEDMIHEDQQRHFVLRSDRQIVAGLITCPPENGVIKIRQMWVLENVTGTGLGRHLLSEVSSLLRGNIIHTLILHARETARGFYEKCGYQTIGDTFIEIGIPHIQMTHHIVRS